MEFRVVKQSSLTRCRGRSRRRSSNVRHTAGISVYAYGWAASRISRGQ